MADGVIAGDNPQCEENVGGSSQGRRGVRAEGKAAGRTRANGSGCGSGKSRLLCAPRCRVAYFFQASMLTISIWRSPNSVGTVTCSPTFLPMMAWARALW